MTNTSLMTKTFNTTRTINHARNYKNSWKIPVCPGLNPGQTVITAVAMSERTATKLLLDPHLPVATVPNLGSTG